jgi:hypothetical protein
MIILSGIIEGKFLIFLYLHCIFIYRGAISLFLTYSDKLSAKFWGGHKIICQFYIWSLNFHLFIFNHYYVYPNMITQLVFSSKLKNIFSTTSILKFKHIFLYTF